MILGRSWTKWVATRHKKETMIALPRRPTSGVQWREGTSPSSQLPPRILERGTHAMQHLVAAVIEDVQARYELGQLSHQIRYDSSGELSCRTLELLARTVHVHVSSLRRYARVTEAIGPDQFTELVTLRNRNGWPLTWSHIELLAEIRDARLRRRHVEETLSSALSVRDLARRVRTGRKEQRG
jgi:hypothetical protein